VEARAAKIRLAKLKEYKNNAAVVSTMMYSHRFFASDPLNDESPEDKTTRDQEGNLKEEAKLEEVEEAIWSSCSVGEGSSL